MGVVMSITIGVDGIKKEKFAHLVSLSSEQVWHEMARSG